MTETFQLSLVVLSVTFTPILDVARMWNSYDCVVKLAKTKKGSGKLFKFMGQYFVRASIIFGILSLLMNLINKSPLRGRGYWIANNHNGTKKKLQSFG